MKKENQVAESRLKTIGDWVKGVSFTLMFAALVACVLDMFFVTPGALTVPVWGYLVLIGAGVALQFAAAAIPNMKLGSRSNKPKPYKIDN